MLKNQNEKNNGSLSMLEVLRRIVNAGNAGSGWYQRRKEAAKEIDRLSRGDLILTSDHYRTDEVRHWITHRKCGNSFKLSLWELRNEAPGNVCPYCASSPEMDRFGSVHHIFDYSGKISNGRSYFIKNQLLASAESWYLFFCMECHANYESDFLTFRNNSDSHRGCEKCRKKYDGNIQR